MSKRQDVSQAQGFRGSLKTISDHQASGAGGSDTD